MEYLNNKEIKDVLIAARELSYMFEEGEFDDHPSYRGLHNLWRAFEDLRLAAKQDAESTHRFFEKSKLIASKFSPPQEKLDAARKD